MTTVFDGLMAIAERLPGTVKGFATGGGDLKLSDTDLLKLYADDTFNGGACLIETGALAGAVLAVADFTNTTGELALAERIWEREGAEVPAAGDVYAVTTRLYHTGRLLIGLREALRAWGDIVTIETLGTGDGDTTAFTVAAGEVVRVALVGEDGDERWWQTLWEQVGTTLTLVGAPPDGATVEAVVRQSVADLLIMPPSKDTLDDTLSNVPAEFIGWYGAFTCLRSVVAVPGQDQDTVIKLMNYYAEQAEVARERNQARGVMARERLMR